MTIVYALGQPRFFEFATARSRHLLPAGAVILAICDGERTTDLLDECTFQRMSDEEYYELQGLIKDAREYERSRSGSGQRAGWLRKFCKL